MHGDLLRFSLNMAAEEADDDWAERWLAVLEDRYDEVTETWSPEYPQDDVSGLPYFKIVVALLASMLAVMVWQWRS